MPGHTLAAMTTLLLTDPTNPRCLIYARDRTRMRIFVQLRSHDLDQALAAGVAPDSSAALSLRAHALLGAKTRGGLARSIRRLIDKAQRPFGPFTPAVPICRRKILASTESLGKLADRLLSSEPVDARGVATVAVLLTDGCGPVYHRPGADDLESVVRQALRALEPEVT